MDATAKLTGKPTGEDYTSRPGALIWFFRKSRDRWKKKHQDLKATVKGFKNQIAAVTKSREQWRLKAEQASERVSALESKVNELRAQAAASMDKKKTDQGSGLLKFNPAEQSVPCGQQYAVTAAFWFVSLVLDCGASLRGAAKVFELFGSATGQDGIDPDRSTGRLWLLRIGLAALLRPKEIAADWVWMVDHSIQIGQCKCLVILGIRLCKLPEGRPLCHQDMELIALVPMTSSTKQTVAVCLENAVAQTGVPRAILDDHGADLHGGVEIFRQAHPETSEFYDIKHKAACLLKAQLEKDLRWKAYASQLGQTKFAVQQTPLACLTPPSQRSKARFMNVGGLVDWGTKTLALVDNPSELERLGISAEQMQAKLGWLEEFRAELAAWSACMAVIERTLDFVRCRGLTASAGRELEATLPAAAGSAGELREQLLGFVTDESSKVRQGERLPGTTEVLESCFGKLKALEDGQSKSGFTGLVLSLGAMVSKWTTESIGEALELCRVRDVLDWCRKNLGPSVQSQRKQAYGAPQCATNPG
jgi:hypothetical protein